MKNVATLATGSLLASAASAQVVQWDIVRRGNGVSRLNKRAGGTVEEIITNERTNGGYFTSCTVGTPPQKLTLQLDTGSSDIWVPASTASVCEDTSQGGCSFGSYDYQQSSTFAVINEDFSISYVDNSHSRGDYITETFGIGNVNLENTTMGLGLDTDIPYGLVGVGYALNEASVAQTGSVSSAYNNLPVVMRDEGHIATNAYSLWLNDLDASTGSILFGGIDTDKYQGDLVRVDVQKDPQTRAFTSFIVELTSLQAHSSSGDDSLTTNFPVNVVLDSGTTLSYLPQDLIDQVWKEVGVEYVTDSSGAAAPLVPCSLANNKGYFAFGFGGTGGPVIKVGLDELVLSLNSGQAPQFPSGQYKGQDACQFGIQNISVSGSNPPTYLLGDTFLRSAYVVYDLENNEIGLAPTDFNATTSHVVAFPSQGATIPSSTAAPSQGSTSSGSGSNPNYSANGGFTSNNNNNNGGKNGASLPAALDFTQLAVMSVSMGFMMIGGGMFCLF
ncbi:aspartic peptidase domain-containing protein [Xylariaceae sp. FL1651]|nr:aspartic peptidase domain-containing protein [Xylariaceae sp. FL1651]